MTNNFFRVVNEARSHSLGPFSPSFNIQTCLLEGLQKHLPQDAHKRVNGRLHISLTRVYDGKNVIVSQFDSREDVLQALLCACFIPGFSGILPPRFRGVRYMDGAFSDNLPILDENTITVSPFCGESDICPRDQSSQLFHLNVANTSIEISRQNINRFIRILFPPRPEFLSNLCQQGFDDALQFLQRNNLISCRRCVAIQSTFVVSETVSETQDYDPECRECKMHRKDASLGNMPETVVDVIQGYIDSANKGLANWLFKSKSIKLLSLPATVPADFLLASINKFSRLAPHIIHQFKHLIKIILIYLNDIVTSKLLNKLSLQMNLDLESFDCIGEMQSNGYYDSKKSITCDEYSTAPRHRDSIFGDDTFDQILKVTTHQDAVYAYYYTDESNKVKLTEIFDMTENESLPPELNIFDGSTDIDSQSLQIESDWNSIESGNNYNEIYDSGIIETNNNNIISHDDKSDYSDNQIDDVTSDYSDPEVDHYVSEHARSRRYSPVPGQQIVEIEN